MSSDPPIAERRPGQHVPSRYRVIAALLVLASCAWLNLRPQFTDRVYRPMEPKYGEGYRSEHGWPLVAFQLFRATHTYDRYGLQHQAPFQVSIESCNRGALAYNVCVALLLLLLSATFYLPWDAYPEPKFSLVELFVFLTSAAIGSTFISSQFAIEPSFGEIAPLAAIWGVGTGTANGFFAHLAWRARRKQALAKQGGAKGKMETQIERGWSDPCQ